MPANPYLFDLPRELVALRPAPQRDASRLLLVDPPRQAVSEISPFRRLVERFSPGDCLVLNDTRVIPARLRGRRQSGGQVEIVLLERGGRQARALVRPLTRLKDHEEIRIDFFSARLIARHADGSVTLDFGELTAAEVAEQKGEPPIPPYLKRPAEALDRDRYQTVYAREPGAVAAPTAGLHFTPELLEAVRDRRVAVAFLTLHVGYGTFAPVQPGQEKLHAEHYEIPRSTCETIAAARVAGKRVIAVGTTVVRALESWAANGAASGWTDIFIRPGYSFNMVDAMVTNFHLPESSLLQLTHAFAGDLLFAAYQQAIAARFRFFSYGDAMFIAGRAA